MSRIAFVTDTTCNLPEPLIQSHNIAIVPVYVIFGDQSFKDYVDLPPVEFYRRLIENKTAGQGMPTTFSPTPEDFCNCYTPLAQPGYSAIISILAPPQSSGTCPSAGISRSMG